MRHRGPYGDRIPGITPKSAASLAAGGSDLPAISDLAQPVHHYRSDTGITKDGSDFVSQWDDQGSGAINVAQATGASQPLWADNDSNFGGRPSITFDGTDDYLVGDSNMTAFDTPYSMAMVMRYTATSSGVDCWLDIDPTNELVTYTSSKKPRLSHQASYWYYEDDIDDTFIFWFMLTDKWYNQLGGSYDETKTWGINYLAQIGGQHNNSSYISPAAQALGLGATNGGTKECAVAIAELIIWNVELVGDEMAGVLQELRTKYDIS